ncbi:TetR/AcrR family transcriptional regulator [Silanimonas sp.]|uniref:TetR/AcrR family transcriptional regulator n=1 Tax=Silanimonas sp. TaxID=1929290 RepID=UPI0037CBA1F1
MRRRRSESGAATVEIIFRCLEELASEKGIDGLSMREVARRSEISLASLQRYFPTKASLFTAFVDRAVAIYRERVTRLEEDRGASGSFESSLQFAAYETMAVARGGVLSMIEARIDRDEVARDCYRNLMSAYLRMLQEAIERRFPSISSSDAQRAAVMICSVLEGLPAAVFAADTMGKTEESVISDAVMIAAGIPSAIQKGA